MLRKMSEFGGAGEITSFYAKNGRNTASNSN